MGAGPAERGAGGGVFRVLAGVWGRGRGLTRGFAGKGFDLRGVEMSWRILARRLRAANPRVGPPCAVIPFLRQIQCTRGLTQPTIWCI